MVLLFTLIGQNSISGLHLPAREAGKCDLDSGQPGAQLQLGVLLLKKKGKIYWGNTVSALSSNWKGDDAEGTK